MLKLKIISFILLLTPISSYSIEILNYYPYSKNNKSGNPINGLNNNDYLLKQEKVEDLTFQKSVKTAVKELEKSISGTCARKITVNLYIEASGGWKIIGIGLKGGIEVEIMNPDFPNSCAHD